MPRATTLKRSCSGSAGASFSTRRKSMAGTICPRRLIRPSTSVGSEGNWCQALPAQNLLHFQHVYAKIMARHQKMWRTKCSSRHLLDQQPFFGEKRDFQSRKRPDAGRNCPLRHRIEIQKVGYQPAHHGGAE